MIEINIGNKVRLNESFFKQKVYFIWENQDEIFTVIDYDGDACIVEPGFDIRFPNESYPDRLNRILISYLEIDHQYYRKKNLDDLLK